MVVHYAMNDGAGCNGISKEHVPSLSAKGPIPPKPATAANPVLSIARNTNHLPLLVASDAASAACAAGLIAPLITVFDR